MDRRLLNVLILSFSFMVLFSALFTTNNIEKIVLDSIAKERENFTGDGYTSLSIIYASYAIFLWIAPSYISLTSARTSILTGFVFSILYTATFLWPQKILLYTSSVLMGLGASLLWTGQGKYLIDNSDASKISRNTAIFWSIFTISLFGGNLFVYCMLTGISGDASSRQQLFTTLTILTLIASAMLIVLENPKSEMNVSKNINSAFEEEKLNGNEVKSQEQPLQLAMQAMKNAFSLLITPQMMFLSIIFTYCGLMLTFYSGVYSSSIGFVVKMGESREKLVSLSGVFIGIGECVGAFLLGTVVPKMQILPGRKIINFGFLLHTVAFISIVVNMPNNAPFKDTEEISFITPSPNLSMVGGLLLGVGDACINTQIYYIISKLYTNDSGSAITIFNFCLALASAISFFYSNYFGLYIQLGILFVIGMFGCITFSIIDNKNKKQNDFILSHEIVVCK